MASRLTLAGLMCLLTSVRSLHSLIKVSGDLKNTKLLLLQTHISLIECV